MKKLVFVLVVVLVAAWARDRWKVASRISEFNSEVEREARRAWLGGDEALRARVVELARARAMDVAPADVGATIEMLSDGHRLSPSEKERIQSIAARGAGASSLAVATITLRGRARGWFGATEFAHEHHVVTEGVTN